MESLAPALVDDMELLIDLLPTDATVLVCDPERVRARAHDLVATSQEFLQASWAAAAGGGQAPVDLGAAAYRTLGDVRTHALARGLRWWSVSPFGLADGADLDPAGDRHAAADRDRRDRADRRRHLQRRRDARRRHPSRRHLPRRHRGRGRRHRRAGQGGATPSCSSPRATARPAARRGARRPRRRRPVWSTSWRPTTSVADRCRTRRAGQPRPRLRRRRDQARRAHRRRPHRAAHHRQGLAADAVAATQADRPARARAPATSSCTSSTASAATSR